MATISSITYYRNGSSGASSVIGYESSVNRVVRGEFTTGASGATSVSISTTAGTIQNVSGDAITKIPFYITTSSTSHANANGNSASITGYITGTASSSGTFSGSASIVLKASTTYYIWFFPLKASYGWAYWNNNSNYYATITLSGTSKYSLSISAGTGSSITVNRTSSPAGLSTGTLSNGAVIYSKDVLKITFSANTNYKLLTNKVNNTTFTSGGSHTVSGNVSVSSTAQVLASKVGATNANIGSVSTITVTKYNDGYYHSLHYSFGSLSGYITSSGGVQSSETKFSNSSVAFTIPTSFYAQIPNAKTGTCTITCKTYSSSGSTTVLGNATTCTLTVTATGNPTVSGTVIDTNPTTFALTGDSSKLIRYKSSAVATITASGQNSAKISKVKINDVTESTNDVSVSTSVTYNSVNANKFVFYTEDSRGYTASTTVNSTMVSYIQLSINPSVARPSPTGDTMTLSFSGDMYRGSFGAASNTLTIKYRYKESGGVYGAWTQLSQSQILFGTSSYRSNGAITLSDSFNYQKEYVFQVYACDGSSDTILSSVTKTITVPRGIPVFDWGEEDFRFNVPIKIGNTTLSEQQLIRLLALLN